MEYLPIDIRRYHLLTQIPFETLINLCQTNTEYATICRNWAWSYLIERDFLGRQGPPVPNQSWYSGSLGPYFYSAVRSYVARSPGVSPDQLRAVISRVATELHNLEWFLRRIDSTVPLRNLIIGNNNLIIRFENPDRYSVEITLFPQEIDITLVQDRLPFLGITWVLNRDDITDKLLTVLTFLIGYYSTLSPTEITGSGGLNDPKIYRTVITPLEIFRDNYPELNATLDAGYYTLDDPRLADEPEQPATVVLHL